MSKELAPIIGNVPANISSLYAQLSFINKEASEGIYAGMYPLIKLSGTRFVLVKDGEEKALKSLDLKVIVLRAKKGFEKRYYMGKYDPNATEAVAPDCYSMNGIAPEAECKKPQNTACAGCKHNQFGTGLDNAGNASKGKACSDRRLLAVLYPNPETKSLEVYGLSIPPASIKAFGAYVNTLTSNNVPLPAAYTTISFDERSSYAVLTFSYGGLLGEKELAQVVPMLESPEVTAIVEAKAPAQSPVAPINAALHAAEESKPAEDNGFGFAEEPKTAKKAKLEAVPVQAAEPVVEEASDSLTDDALAAMLGL